MRPRRGEPPHRRAPRRQGLAGGAGHRRLPHGRAAARRGPERADGSPGHLRRPQPLHRGLLPRQRARPHLGQLHGPRQRERGRRHGGLRLRAPRLLDVERRHRPGPPRPVPGQAQCLRLFRQSPRGPRRRPGLCRRLEPQLGRDLGGRKRPPRRRLVGRVPHPLQDDLLQARAQRLGPQHRADDRPQDGDDPAVRHDPRQQLQQPQRSGHDAGDRRRQAGHGHHLPAVRPVQRRQRQPGIEPVRHRGRRRVRPL